jgi:hypothetical protein
MRDTIMLNELKNMVDTTNPNVIGQVLKKRTNMHLYQWVLSESETLGPDVTIVERIYYLLQEKPSIICENNNRRTFSQKKKTYGFCGNINKCPCFRQHAKDTYIPRDMTVVIEKRKETWLKKYGVDNIAKTAETKSKRAETMAKKNYSHIWNRMSHEKETVGYYQVLDRVKDLVSPLFSREEYAGSRRYNKYDWLCNTCAKSFQSHIDYGTVPKCPDCYPKTISAGEKSIGEFIQTLGVAVILNDRTVLDGKEIDIYVPEKKTAVEYNGVYWHSDKKKEPNYHVNKYLACQQQGIRLVQIFEDEWINTPDIVRDRLRNILGFSQKLYARKCNIVELTTKEYKEFTTAQHIRGYAHSTIKYGLTYNNKLVAVMGFSKSRYTKTGYELIRYCSKDTVIGGAGKLLSHFKKEHLPESIVTYADRCWSDGGLYRKLGFTDETSDQLNTGYWYIKDNIRYHRSNFTKSRLVSMGHSPELSEAQIMNNMGYARIYDCGNYKFIWKSKI